ncbi:MAG TPA: hypothetical protein VD927_16500 [Chryseosolibacter sp.]|nr:hypothetical protein [Chryseosolibacter sp.]
MNAFTEWWETLGFPLIIYWAIAIPFTVLFALQMIWSFFTGDDVPDDTPDAEVQGDTGIPFQFFSIRNFIGFFTIFGWVGIAATDSGFSVLTSLILSLSAGFAMMLIMASIAYFLSKATADGSMKIERAVGHVGQVYLTVPKSRTNLGKVQVVVQGSLRTLEALTDDQDDIPNGKVIKVKQVVNDNILLVTAE